jgi:putative ATP-grasp target RiPP
MTLNVADDDPVAPHSARFPLASLWTLRNNTDPPSLDGVRPWGLRGMHIPERFRTRRVNGWRYDHEQQLAVDQHGAPVYDVRMGDPTADSCTSSDGDEGPTEDFVYD